MRWRTLPEQIPDLNTIKRICFKFHLQARSIHQHQCPSSLMLLCLNRRTFPQTHSKLMWTAFENGGSCYSYKGENSKLMSMVSYRCDGQVSTHPWQWVVAMTITGVCKSVLIMLLITHRPLLLSVWLPLTPPHTANR